MYIRNFVVKNTSKWKDIHANIEQMIKSKIITSSCVKQLHSNYRLRAELKLKIKND